PAPTVKPLTAAQQQAKTDAIASAVGATSALPLVDSGATLYRTTHPDYQNFTGTLWVATPQLLRHFGITPEPGADVITSRPGLDAVAHLQLRSDQPPDGPQPDAHERPAAVISHPVIQESSKLPKGTAAPNVVVTEQALRRLGMSPAGTSDQWWFVEAPKPLTSTQKSTAEEIAAAAGMTVATTNSQPSLRSLETWSVAAGILLALGVLAMTSGLIRSEAAGGLRTPTAPRGRKRGRPALHAHPGGR